MRGVVVLGVVASLLLVLVAARAGVGLTRFTDQTPAPANDFSVGAIGGCASGNTGWLSPSAQAAEFMGGGNGFEITPANAFTDGGVDPNYRAQNINGPNDRHRYYNYNIAIPAACTTITGIEVRLDWWLDSTVNNSRMRVQLSWDGGTTWTAQVDDAVQTTVEHTGVLGTPTTTWGRVWSAAELTNANFVVHLRAQSSGNGHANRDFFLDWVPIRVHYAP